MKIFNYIKSVLAKSCVYYTVISLVMYTGAAVSGNKNMIPTLSSVITFFIFAVFVSLIGYVLTYGKISPVLRILIHFTGLGVVFYLLFIVIGGYGSGSGLVAVFIYTVIYAVCAAATLLLRRVKSRKKQDETPYKKQF